MSVGSRPSPDTAEPVGLSPEADRTEDVRRGFTRLLGDAAVTESTSGTAPVLLCPGTEEEVSAVLRLASERGWRVVPRGAGTWLGAGGSVRDPDAHLSVAGLDRIVQYEPADLTLSVGAGASLSGVRSATAAERQWLPLDPAGSSRGTLGATLATASAGGLANAYGAPRDLCLGLRMVTGDGRRLSFGGRVVKNVAGFDMVKLAVGSWGTLGVITEATLRLHPLPEVEARLEARAPRLEDLIDAARRAATAGVPPAAVELVERHVGGGREAVLRVRVYGLGERVEREVRDLRERVGPLALERLEGDDHGPEDAGDPFAADLAAVDEEVELSLRMLLPPTELPDLVDIARDLGRKQGSHDELAGVPVRIAVDAGRAGLTVGVPSLRQDPARAEDWTRRLRELRRALELRGGSLTLLEAPPGLVDSVGVWGDLGGAGRVMARLKAQFDPAGILSPGRLAIPCG